MSATILPFETTRERTERLIEEGAAGAVVLSPTERNERYWGVTLGAVKKLMLDYQRTGAWTESCDAPMATAVQSLKEVCRLMSFTKLPEPATLVIPKKEPDDETENAR
tara:strand:+ start:2029 stop:2352 length:324 start_codon:yes stop_codon:yes gene_type:complete